MVVGTTNQGDDYDDNDNNNKEQHWYDDDGRNRNVDDDDDDDAVATTTQRPSSGITTTATRYPVTTATSPRIRPSNDPHRDCSSYVPLYHPHRSPPAAAQSLPYTWYRLHRIFIPPNMPPPLHGGANSNSSIPTEVWNTLWYDQLMPIIDEIEDYNNYYIYYVGTYLSILLYFTTMIVCAIYIPWFTTMSILPGIVWILFAMMLYIGLNHWIGTVRQRQHNQLQTVCCETNTNWLYQYGYTLECEYQYGSSNTNAPQSCFILYFIPTTTNMDTITTTTHTATTTTGNANNPNLIVADNDDDIATSGTTHSYQRWELWKSGPGNAFEWTPLSTIPTMQWIHQQQTVDVSTTTETTATGGAQVVENNNNNNSPTGNDTTSTTAMEESLLVHGGGDGDNHTTTTSPTMAGMGEDGLATFNDNDEHGEIWIQFWTRLQQVSQRSLSQHRWILVLYGVILFINFPPIFPPLFPMFQYGDNDDDDDPNGSNNDYANQWSEYKDSVREFLFWLVIVMVASQSCCGRCMVYSPYCISPPGSVTTPQREVIRQYAPLILERYGYIIQFRHLYTFEQPQPFIRICCGGWLSARLSSWWWGWHGMDYLYIFKSPSINAPLEPTGSSSLFSPPPFSAPSVAAVGTTATSPGSYEAPNVNATTRL